MAAKKHSKSLSPPRKDPVMNRLADTLGQDELVGALHSSADERVHRLAEMMTDPAYSRFTLGKLCERVGLSTLDLLDAFRKYKIDQGIIEMSRHAPEIMEDIARDAESRMEACKKCRGTGTVKDKNTEETGRCLHCAGEGQVRVPGDYRARRLFFKVMTTGQGPR